MSDPVSHHGSPGLRARAELGGLLDVESAFEQAADAGARMLVAIGDAIHPVHDLVEPEQPAAARLNVPMS